MNYITKNTQYTTNSMCLVLVAVLVACVAFTMHTAEASSTPKTTITSVTPGPGSLTIAWSIDLAGRCSVDTNESFPVEVRKQSAVSKGNYNWKSVSAATAAVSGSHKITGLDAEEYQVSLSPNVKDCSPGLSSNEKNKLFGYGTGTPLADSISATLGSWSPEGNANQKTLSVSSVTSGCISCIQAC